MQSLCIMYNYQLFIILSSYTVCFYIRDYPPVLFLKLSSSAARTDEAGLKWTLYLSFFRSGPPSRSELSGLIRAPQRLCLPAHCQSNCSECSRIPGERWCEIQIWYVLLTKLQKSPCTHLAWAQPAPQTPLPLYHTILYIRASKERKKGNKVKERDRPVY